MTHGSRTSPAAAARQTSGLERPLTWPFVQNRHAQGGSGQGAQQGRPPPESTQRTRIPSRSLTGRKPSSARGSSGVGPHSGPVVRCLARHCQAPRLLARSSAHRTRVTTLRAPGARCAARLLSRLGRSTPSLRPDARPAAADRAPEPVQCWTVPGGRAAAQAACARCRDRRAAGRGRPAQLVVAVPRSTELVAAPPQLVLVQPHQGQRGPVAAPADERHTGRAAHPPRPPCRLRSPRCRVRYRTWPMPASRRRLRRLPCSAAQRTGKGDVVGRGVAHVGDRVAPAVGRRDEPVRVVELVLGVDAAARGRCRRRAAAASARRPGPGPAARPRAARPRRALRSRGPAAHRPTAGRRRPSRGWSARPSGRRWAAVDRASRSTRA